MGAGLWLLFLAVNPGRNEMTDARTRLDVAREIWTEGRVSVPPSRVTFRRYWIALEDGRLVSYYGLGQSLVFIPFDIAGVALTRLFPVSPARREVVGWFPIGLGFLPLLGLLWWTLLVKVLRETGLGARLAAFAAAAALLGTIAFFYVSNEQEEALVGCLMAAALLLGLRWRRTGSVWDAAGAGAFSGFAVLTRTDAVFGLLPVAFLFAGHALLSHRHRRVILAVGAAACCFAVPAGGMLAYNFARFHSVFETGYGRFGLANLWKLEPRCLPTIAALLVGPGKGLFLLSPLLLVALFGLSEFRRRMPLVFLGSAAGFSAALVFYSAFQGNSDGPWSWGTRYLAHFITLWAIPLAFAIEGSRRRRRAFLAVLAIAGLSAAIQVASVFITQNLEYVQLRGEGGRGWTTLMTSGRRGQLDRRVRNIASWTAGPRKTSSIEPAPAESIPPGTDSEKAAFIEARYIPNFWGPAFAKRASGNGKSAILALWWVSLVSGLGLLLAAVFRRWPEDTAPTPYDSEDIPPPSPALRRALLPAVSLLAIGFLWGFASHWKKLFPYGLIKRAALETGYRPAWRQQAASAERVAALRSIPYMSGSYDPDHDQRGVVLSVPEKFSDGCNLYYSRRGHCSFLVDMKGRLLWRWCAEAALGRNTVDPDGWINFLLTPDGKTLLNVQNVGLVRVDEAGRPVWKLAAPTHHDLSVDSHGTIYAPEHRRRAGSPVYDEPILDDGVLVADAAGKLQREISLLDLFARSPYSFLLPRTQTSEFRSEAGLEPFHLNHIEIFDGSLSRARLSFARAIGCSRCATTTRSRSSIRGAKPSCGPGDRTTSFSSTIRRS